MKTGRLMVAAAAVLMPIGMTAAEEPAATPALVSGAAEIRFPPDGGIRVCREGVPHFTQDRPLRIEVVDTDGTAALHDGTYDAVVQDAPGRVVCTGTVVSPAGTTFRFTDRFELRDADGSFAMARSVTIAAPRATDVGFSTSFGLQTAEPKTLADLSFFAPGIWYRDNAKARNIASAENQRDDSFFFYRETRSPAPCLMVQDKANGIHCTIAQARPDSATTFAGDDFLPRIVDERIRTGSLGVEKKARPFFGYLYPASEGEITYVTGYADAWAPRSHPVKTDVRHDYSLVIRVGRDAEFRQAMESTWRHVYDLYAPAVHTSDLEDAYAQSIALLHDLAVPRGPLSVRGFPFTVFIRTGEVENPSYQAGFIGMQLGGAYHLVRHGLETGSASHLERGRDIIDFWVNNAYRDADSELPSTWFAGGWGNNWKTDNATIRQLADAGYGIVRAYELEKAAGTDRTAWLAYCERFGAWLADNRRDDGSWCNRYTLRGDPDPIKGESGSGTLFPVPFLLKLHAVTGKDLYLDVAVTAGEYGFNEFHLKDEYTGGAIDNPDVLDKESTMLGFRAFLMLYEATGEPKWLEAAKAAATFSETWTYIRDVPIPDEAYALYKMAFGRPFHATGLSLVASGLSYADWYNARHAGDFYRLYRITGDPHYRHFSDILLHNTKQTMDIRGSAADGRYARPGLQPEGMGVAVDRGRHNRFWLPFVTVVQLDGMTERAAAETQDPPH